MTDAATGPSDLDGQRAELAETVDALRAKLDVPARSKAAVKNQVARIDGGAAVRNGLIAAALLAAVVLVVRRIRAS